MQATNPISAATHADPYPYYRHLLAGPGLHFDPGLKLWVASRAAVIREVFDHPQCLVRPAGEPVPATIAGSAAGEVFARLVRMNEGAGHARPRLAIGQALAAIDPGRVADTASRFADILGKRCDMSDGAALTSWAFDLPTYVVADLLGFGRDVLAPVARWMADFVRCLSPLSTAEQLSEASTAAQALMTRFEELVQAGEVGSTTLLGEVQRRAGAAGWTDQRAVLANLVGLLSQTHEATAGLIGNSIVTLIREPRWRDRLHAEPALIAAFVREVARFDPPVQNTRRFVSGPITVAGESLDTGDTILLLLAAAGRDEKVHDDPDVFRLDRQQQLLGFGHGRHACPGQDLALAIAVSAIDYLLSKPVPLDVAALSWSYRPSANGRLPIFCTATEHP